MIIVEKPWFLLFLLLIPLLVFLSHFWSNRGGRILFPFSFYKSRQFTPPHSLVRYLDFISTACFWLVMVLLVIIMSGPVKIQRERVFFDSGIEIMIVLDESPSMAARGERGSRFEIAKSVIRNFIQARGNDSIGLVSFSSEAVLAVPLTLDYPFLIKALDRLDIMSLGDGTAIGMGILMAVLSMSSSTNTEKIIILLTDGVNNTGEVVPRTAAEVAGDFGIRIYTIGIGSQEESFVEFVNPETNELYRGVTNEKPDEELLREIASMTSGSFFSVGNENSLATVFETINTAESVEKRSIVEVRTQNLYREFTILVLILLVVHLCLSKIVIGGGL